MYSNTRWAFQGEWRLGYNAHHGYEVETHFGRYLGKIQWLFPYVGVDWRYREGPAHGTSLLGQQSSQTDRKVVHAGMHYTMPGLIVLDGSVDHNVHFSIQLIVEEIPLPQPIHAIFIK